MTMAIDTADLRKQAGQERPVTAGATDAEVKIHHNTGHKDITKRC